MKKIIAVFFFFFIVFAGYSQKRDAPLDGDLVDKKASVNMYHNPVDLEKLNKDVLVRIYIKRVMALMELIPFSALNSEKGRRLEDLGVPATKNNIKLLEKYVKKKEKFEEHLEETMLKTIVYAEKEDLVSMILLIERFLGDLKDHVH